MSLPMKSGRIAIADELAPSPTVVNRGRLGPTPIDRLWQRAFAVAHRLLRLWWFVRRPHHRGALVALWHGGEILLLRTSYRRHWGLPGGGVHRGEDARRAALRETREEIGLALPASVLREAVAIELFWEHRHDHVTIFEVALEERPPLHLDQREIVAAVFRAPATIAPKEVSPHIAHYLARRRRG